MELDPAPNIFILISWILIAGGLGLIDLYIVSEFLKKKALSLWMLGVGSMILFGVIGAMWNTSRIPQLFLYMTLISVVLLLPPIRLVMSVLDSERLHVQYRTILALVTMPCAILFFYVWVGQFNTGDVSAIVPIIVTAPLFVILLFKKLRLKNG